MSYRVRTERRATSLAGGGTVWILESDQARAEIWPALGFNGYRWQVERDGLAYELLYAAGNLFEEPVPTRSGFPILFPFPNRIRAGRFTWQGKEYQLPVNDSTRTNAIHGFACRRPWRVVDHGTDERSAWVTGEFQGTRDAPDCVALWPADYRIRVIYRLAADSLRVEALVENPDQVPLPFGLGYHPYFRRPFCEKAAPRSIYVDVPAASFWELEDCLPTGQRLPVAGTRDLRLATPLKGLQLDDVLTGLEPKAARSDGLVDLGCVDQDEVGVRLFCSPDFREMVVFTPPHGKAVCLEPYTCVTDAINLQQRGIDAGWRVLQPGQRWNATVQCDLV